MTNFEKFASGFSIATGLFAIGYSYIQGRKSHEIANKLDMSLDELSRKTKLDITDSMVNAAVDKITNREVGSMVRSKASEISSDISHRLTTDIHDAVKSSYEEAKIGIENKLFEECSAVIDPESLKQDIQKKVNERIVAEAWKKLGLDKMFSIGSVGNSYNETDIEKLAALLDKIPTYERSGVISSIFGN